MQPAESGAMMDEPVCKYGGHAPPETANFASDNLPPAANDNRFAIIAAAANKSVSYDALGDILTKSDVGTYSYGGLSCGDCGNVPLAPCGRTFPSLRGQGTLLQLLY